MERYTLRDFERDFPNDDACLDWLRTFLYPDGIYCKSCAKVTKHHRVRSRPSYSCDRCGRHEHPMAGTVFGRSRTPLRLWFRAIFLMASTRCGISAKHLERELGVTYKTAWRMFRQIRLLLGTDLGGFGSTVEIDETYVGGRIRYRAGGMTHAEKSAARMENKTRVLGMVERRGRVQAHVAPHGTVLPFVTEKVLPDAMVYTDEHKI